MFVVQPAQIWDGAFVQNDEFFKTKSDDLYEKFKVYEKEYASQSAVDQVFDYALDLNNFHKSYKFILIYSFIHSFNLFGK